MKKKIKNIKQYVGGGITLTPQQQQLMQQQMQLGSFNQTDAYAQMAKPVTVPQTLQAPAAPAAPSSKGINMGGIGDAIGGAAQLIGGIGGSSTATNQKEVVSQSLADVGQGAAAGAKIGSMLGPIGGAIGAVGGAIVGSIGKKGKIEQTEGFTEDNQYTLSTGFRALGNKKLKKKIALDKSRVQANRIAVEQTPGMQQEWIEDYGETGDTFANGGQVGYEPAYVDDGELLQTPDGQVSQVPEQGQPTDSNLMNLPGGTRILSDKLKVPGTKQTFAQLGEKMMIKRKSKGTDRFAENASKLNNMNNSMIHDQLFSLQEATKSTSGSKGIQKFVRGGVVKEFQNTLNQEYANRNRQLPEVNVTAAAPKYKPIWNQGMSAVPNTLPKLKQLSSPSSIPVQATANAGTPSVPQAAGMVAGSGVASPVKDGRTGSKFNFGPIRDGIASGLTDVAALAPALSNIFTGDPESTRAVHNPYAGMIQNTMRKRRFDIDPALQQLKTNRAVSDYNASQSNTNTGSNMAYRLQSAVGLDKATTDLYSQASNIQNQYDADYANTMNSLGQQYVGATNMAQDTNARSRAANRNIRRAGMSQLGEYAQNKQLMSNQKRKDKAMLTLYKPFLEAGNTKDTVTELMKYFR